MNLGLLLSNGEPVSFQGLKVLLMSHYVVRDANACEIRIPDTARGREFESCWMLGSFGLLNQKSVIIRSLDKSICASDCLKLG